MIPVTPIEQFVGSFRLDIDVANGTAENHNYSTNSLSLTLSQDLSGSGQDVTFTLAFMVKLIEFLALAKWKSQRAAGIILDFTAARYLGRLLKAERVVETIARVKEMSDEAHENEDIRTSLKASQQYWLNLKVRPMTPTECQLCYSQGMC